jgi:hypothetical protein
VCNYIIHEQGSVYVDDLYSDYSNEKNFSIFYSVHTDLKDEIYFKVNDFLLEAEKITEKIIA